MARKMFTLRFDEDLLAEVDEAAGTGNRTSFIESAVRMRLGHAVARRADDAAARAIATRSRSAKAGVKPIPKAGK